VFGGDAPPGYIRVSDLSAALLTYAGTGAAGASGGGGAGGATARGGGGGKTARTAASGGGGVTKRSGAGGGGVTGRSGDSEMMAAIAAGGLTEERVAELLSQLEPDSGGFIAYADFVDMMMQ
jgi:hypothetical protein